MVVREVTDMRPDAAKPTPEVAEPFDEPKSGLLLEGYREIRKLPEVKQLCGRFEGELVVLYDDFAQRESHDGWFMRSTQTTLMVHDANGHERMWEIV